MSLCWKPCSDVLLKGQSYNIRQVSCIIHSKR
uniref:Uncharacterized protein n=1 Tax=Anguilla anguilla TaxID=7936 RepID=A0A0E9T2C9_ANGAN